MAVSCVDVEDDDDDELSLLLSSLLWWADSIANMDSAIVLLGGGVGELGLSSESDDTLFCIELCTSSAVMLEESLEAAAAGWNDVLVFALLSSSFR